MELNGAKILYTIHTDIPILGDFKITQTLVSTWIVMALLTALAFWLGHDLKLENVSISSCMKTWAHTLTGISRWSARSSR